MVKVKIILFKIYNKYIKIIIIILIINYIIKLVFNLHEIDNLPIKSLGSHEET